MVSNSSRIVQNSSNNQFTRTSTNKSPTSHSRIKHQRYLKNLRRLIQASHRVLAKAEKIEEQLLKPRSTIEYRDQEGNIQEQTLIRLDKVEKRIEQSYKLLKQIKANADSLNQQRRDLSHTDNDQLNQALLSLQYSHSVFKRISQAEFSKIPGYAYRINNEGRTEDLLHKGQKDIKIWHTINSSLNVINDIQAAAQATMSVWDKENKDKATLDGLLASLDRIKRDHIDEIKNKIDSQAEESATIHAGIKPGQRLEILTELQNATKEIADVSQEFQSISNFGPIRDIRRSQRVLQEEIKNEKNGIHNNARLEGIKVNLKLQELLDLSKDLPSSSITSKKSLDQLRNRQVNYQPQLINTRETNSNTAIHQVIEPELATATTQNKEPKRFHHRLESLTSELYRLVQDNAGSSIKTDAKLLLDSIELIVKNRDSKSRNDQIRVKDYSKIRQSLEKLSLIRESLTNFELKKRIVNIQKSLSNLMEVKVQRTHASNVAPESKIINLIDSRLRTEAEKEFMSTISKLYQSTRTSLRAAEKFIGQNLNKLVNIVKKQKNLASVAKQQVKIAYDMFWNKHRSNKNNPRVEKIEKDFVDSVYQIYNIAA